MDNQTQQEISNQLKCFNSEASKGCGGVYELYFERLSKSISSYIERLHGEHKLFAIDVANNKYDYCHGEEYDFEPQDGFCKHHLDPNCCPAGCGEL